VIFEFKGRWYRRMAPYKTDGKRRQVLALGVLSTRALKLYQRVIAGGFYNPHSDRTPNAMKELINNGLVGTAGRVVVVERCFVPTHGYKCYQPEEFAE